MTQPSWIGHTLGGRYKIEGLLGQGGMSAVYRATDPNLRRQVAVKVIHPHLATDAEFVRRFEEEAAAVARLRHPNIIQVYDFSHDNNAYFMVLEFLPGETLESRLKRLNAAQRRLPLEETVRIASQICEAVGYAHNQGMIHRDLKPANVMISPDGAPVLMDFGIVKILGGDTQTATGSMIGTVAYMAPEQIRGERADARTDIYALGVMLFEMVSGRRPFQGDSAPATMMMHLTQPVPDVRALNHNTPPALVRVIERALAKQPAERFQRASEMAQALAAASTGAATGQFTTAGTPTRVESLGPPGLATAPPVLAGGQPGPAGRGVHVPAPPRASRAARPWMIGGLAVGLLGLVLLCGVVALVFGDQLFGGPTPAATATSQSVLAEATAPPEAPTEGATAAAGAATATSPVAAAATNTAPPQPTLRPSDTATSPPATPTVAPSPTLIPTPAGPRAQISGIQLSGGRYEISFNTSGFEYRLPGMHVHFFFDSVPPEQAGVPGSGPWRLYGGPSPFTEYSPADRPTSASQMCILVANPDHSVVHGTGNCLALP